MNETERLLQFLYLVPVGLIETDAQGKIRQLNPLATQTLLLIGGPTRLMNAFDALENVLRLGTLGHHADAKTATVGHKHSRPGHRVETF